jgi:hypothetical protein
VNEQITVQFQIGRQTEESVRLQRLMKTRSTPITEQAPRTVEEWRITGEPGSGYPSYRFTFSSDRYETPQEAARAYVEAMTDWDDGPHLEHRTITYTAWETTS